MAEASSDAGQTHDPSLADAMIAAMDDKLPSARKLRHQPAGGPDSLRDAPDDLRLTARGAVCDLFGRLDVSAYKDLKSHFAGEAPRDRHPDPRMPGMLASELAAGSPDGLRWWSDAKGEGWIASHPTCKAGQTVPESKWFSARTGGSWRFAYLLARLQRRLWETLPEEDAHHSHRRSVGLDTCGGSGGAGQRQLKEALCYFKQVLVSRPSCQLASLNCMLIDGADSESNFDAEAPMVPPLLASSGEAAVATSVQPLPAASSGAAVQAEAKPQTAQILSVAGSAIQARVAGGVGLRLRLRGKTRIVQVISFGQQEQIGMIGRQQSKSKCVKQRKHEKLQHGVRELPTRSLFCVAESFPGDPEDLCFSRDSAICDVHGKLVLSAYTEFKKNFLDEAKPELHPDPSRPGMRLTETSGPSAVALDGLRTWNDAQGRGWIAQRPAGAGRKVEHRWFSVAKWGSWRLAFLLARLQRQVYMLPEPPKPAPIFDNQGVLEHVGQDAGGQAGAIVAFEIQPFTPLTINTKQCLARTWSNGQGGQCDRAVVAGSCLCIQHQLQSVRTMGLVHGVVNGPIPSAKSAEFERVERARGLKRRSDAGSCASAADAAAAKSLEPPCRRRRTGSASSAVPNAQELKKGKESAKKTRRDQVRHLRGSVLSAC